MTDPAGHVTNYTYDSYGDVATTPSNPSSGVTDVTLRRLRRRRGEALRGLTVGGGQRHQLSVGRQCSGARDVDVDLQR